MLLNDWKKSGRLFNEKKVPERKERGDIIKFVIVAVWSNFSAQRPVIKPSAPKINEPKKPKIKT